MYVVPCRHLWDGFDSYFTHRGRFVLLYPFTTFNTSIYEVFTVNVIQDQRLLFLLPLIKSEDFCFVLFCWLYLQEILFHKYRCQYFRAKKPQVLTSMVPSWVIDIFPTNQINQCGRIKTVKHIKIRFSK